MHAIFLFTEEPQYTFGSSQVTITLYCSCRQMQSNSQTLLHHISSKSVVQTILVKREMYSLNTTRCCLAHLLEPQIRRKKARLKAVSKTD